MEEKARNLKLHMRPDPRTTPTNNGVGQVIAALYKHLPAYGIEFVDSPKQADVVACHINKQGLDRIDVLHCHGLEWTGDGLPGYEASHSDTNRSIADAARGARVITVPSDWVAQPFRRDMRINPVVIGHGVASVEVGPYKENKKQSYILWNKNRTDAICDPTPAIELARRGYEVVSTFGDPKIMRVTGVLPHDKMLELVKNASYYLATTKETFGIGVLEALAYGVPVLGYAWGGNLDLIEHKVNGYLVAPGDIEGLAEGQDWLRRNYEEVSKNAALSAENYDWSAVISKYATVYMSAAFLKQASVRIGVVVTTHNYGQYIVQTLNSLFAQTVLPDVVCVIDDASTDGTFETIKEYQRNLPDELRAKVAYVGNRTNQGVAYSRNLAIQETHGEVLHRLEISQIDGRKFYLICLDADDWLEPTYIEKCANFLDKNPDVGITYTSLAQHFPDGTVGVSGWPPNQVEFEKIAIDGAVPPANGVPSAAMFRYDAWLRSGRGYIQEHAPGEDAEFWLKILASGYRAVKCTNEPLFNYRLHAGSASRSKQYRSITAGHPWAKDKMFPFAVPVSESYRMPLVRSYSEPLVSVVIPVGPGHGGYVPIALDSLLSQTFRNWEVIVVDDTSNGFYLENSIRPRYPFARFAYVPKELKHGAGVARNEGLRHANPTSKFVLWLDADDWLAPTAIADMLEGYVKSGASYVYSDWYLVKPEDKLGDYELMSCLDYDQKAWLKTPQHAVTALIEIEAARQVPFDEDVASWEDWFYFADFAVKGFCGARVPKPLLYYRLQTGTRREKALANSKALKKEFDAKFSPYLKEGTSMAGCCGGRAPVIQAVVQALTEEQKAALAAQAKENGLVPMVYIGANVGPYPDMVNGRIYKGANTESDRNVLADPRDVDRLLQTGRWQRAG